MLNYHRLLQPSEPMKKEIMKESARQIVTLDWVFFGISVAMIIAGVFRIAVGQ